MLIVNDEPERVDAIPASKAHHLWIPVMMWMNALLDFTNVTLALDAITTLEVTHASAPWVIERMMVANVLVSYINECTESNGACCSVNATCINKEGSYGCVCNEGTIFIRITIFLKRCKVLLRLIGVIEIIWDIDDPSHAKFTQLYNNRTLEICRNYIFIYLFNVILN
ncbi:unnamed protein product [Strongylus vulgaris]|uniref:EGF-like calcium-binding domain-containing protein n=1 Tax=Strongylus vulgaris TaxID=40348 RepID=A0A3P7IU65_STRVU|nr:unnamed protein product [Strongylus vulgaris]